LAQAKALANDFGGLNYANILQVGSTFSQIHGFVGNEYNEPRDAQTVQATD
jgi:hypothetical protein